MGDPILPRLTRHHWRVDHDPVPPRHQGGGQRVDYCFYRHRLSMTRDEETDAIQFFDRHGLAIEPMHDALDHLDTWAREVVQRARQRGCTVEAYFRVFGRTDDGTLAERSLRLREYVNLERLIGRNGFFERARLEGGLDHALHDPSSQLHIADSVQMFVRVLAEEPEVELVGEDAPAEEGEGDGREHD